MQILNTGNGSIAGGPNYKWALEVDDPSDPGCFLTVSIDLWKLTRPFPMRISADQASTIAAEIAEGLLMTINAVE